MRFDVALLLGAAVSSLIAWAGVQWLDAWHPTAAATMAALLLIGILFHRIERRHAS